MELLTPCAAPLTAGPADEVTLDSPSEAFDDAADAVSFPFAAVFEAAWVASEVVEAWRRAERRATTRLCRSINREGADDMTPVDLQREESEVVQDRGLRCDLAEIVE